MHKSWKLEPFTTVPFSDPAWDFLRCLLQTRRNDAAICLMDTNCNSNMMTFLNLVKSGINLGKKKKNAEDIARDNEHVTMECHKQ